MNIREKILRDYTISEAFSMRGKLLKNINSSLETSIQSQCPQNKLKELLDIREKLLNVSLDEFLELEFDEELQKFIYM